jgi:hypothetical protein
VGREAANRPRSGRAGGAGAVDSRSVGHYAGAQKLGAGLTDALNKDQGASVRRFTGGLVVVNPRDAAIRYDLGGSFPRVIPHGGGAVPDSGQIPATWGLTQTVVTSVTLGPRQAAILVR